MYQLSLDSEEANDQPKVERLALPDAQVFYYPHWIASEQATALQEALQSALCWRQDTITLFGKQMKIPRLQAWYGDEHCHYGYSGMRLSPLSWTKPLAEIRDRLAAETGAAFNCVLANWYRDGSDSMSFHADDEPELGVDPVIASVTLGEPRTFILKHVKTKAQHKIALEHGSLLVMGRGTQQHYVHGINKTKRNVGPRINLTFRYLHRR